MLQKTAFIYTLQKGGTQKEGRSKQGNSKTLELNSANIKQFYQIVDTLDTVEFETLIVRGVKLNFLPMQKLIEALSKRPQKSKINLCFYENILENSAVNALFNSLQNVYGQNKYADFSPINSPPITCIKAFYSYGNTIETPCYITAKSNEYKGRELDELATLNKTPSFLEKIKTPEQEEREKIGMIVGVCVALIFACGMLAAMGIPIALISGGLVAATLCLLASPIPIAAGTLIAMVVSSFFESPKEKPLPGYPHPPSYHLINCGKAQEETMHISDKNDKRDASYDNSVVNKTVIDASVKDTMLKPTKDFTPTPIPGNGYNIVVSA